MIRIELTECKLYEIYDDFLNNTNDLVTICGYEYEPANSMDNLKVVLKAKKVKTEV